jgi:hypothetical protein
MTEAEIENAGIQQLLSWWRFSPVGSVDNSKMQRIGERIAELKEAEPGSFVAASKSLGW